MSEEKEAVGVIALGTLLIGTPFLFGLACVTGICAAIEYLTVNEEPEVEPKPVKWVQKVKPAIAEVRKRRGQEI